MGGGSSAPRSRQALETSAAGGLQALLTELRRFSVAFGDFWVWCSRKRLILRVWDLEKRRKAAVVPTKGIFSWRDL
jgi:hypothetical protein